MSPSRKQPLSALISFLVLFSGHAHAQPWVQDDHQKQQERNDPERFSRSRTQLEPQDLKARAQLVKTTHGLLFKGGEKPANSVLELGDPDASGKTPLRVEAAFGDLSDQLKQEVLKRNPGQETTLTDTTLITIDAAVTADNTLDIVQAAAAPMSAPLAQTETIPSAVTASDPVSTPQAVSSSIETPSAAPAAGPAESTKEPSGPDVKQAPPPPKEEPAFTKPNPPAPAKANPAPLQSHQLSGKARELFIVAKSLAPTLGGLPSLARLTETPDQSPIVFLGLKNGGEIAVTQVKEVRPGTFEVEVHGAKAAFPPDWVKPLEQKAGAQTFGPRDVARASVRIKPDNSIVVLKTGPSDIQVRLPQESSTPSPRAAQTRSPSQKENRAVSLPFSPETLAWVQTAFAIPPKVGEAAVRSVPAGTQNRPEPGVRLNYDQPNAVTVFRLSEAGATPLHTRAEGKLGNFPAPTREKIKSLLKEAGGENLVGSQTTLAVEGSFTSEGTFVPERIETVHAPARKDEEPARVVLVDRPRAAPNAPKASSRKDPSPASPSAATGNQLPTRLSGALPAAAKLIQMSFRSAPQAPVQLKPALVGNPLVFSPPALTERAAPRIFYRQGHLDSSSFFVEARLDDLEASLREKVEALLREAAENGEEWAKEALEKGDNVLLLLEVSLEPEKGVTVKEVKAGLKGEALALAIQLGLPFEEVNFLMDGQNGLISLLQGQEAQVERGAETLALKRGEGELHFLVKTREEGVRPPLTLYLTRPALVENKEALTRLLNQTGAEEAPEAIMSRLPDAQRFVVQIPEGNDGGRIEAIK